LAFEPSGFHHYRKEMSLEYQRTEQFGNDKRIPNPGGHSSFADL
jgi:hypothetical protein